MHNYTRFTRFGVKSTSLCFGTTLINVNRHNNGVYSGRCYGVHIVN